MAVSEHKYKRLVPYATEHQSEHEIRRGRELSLWKVIYILSILLSISITSNTILLARLYQTQGLLDSQSYVGLQRNVPVPILHDNRTIDDEMWELPENDPFPGFVALPDDFAKRKGLPTAMKYPWDPSKSIYVLNGFHSLHCVHVLRQVIIEYRAQKEQTWPHPHATHCLHVFHEDTICNADDTPRYTGRLHAEANHGKVSSGIGQPRMCRDWGKLRQFALENSACYRRPLDRHSSLLDRYKTCPDGSKPWEVIAFTSQELLGNSATTVSSEKNGQSLVEMIEFNNKVNGARDDSTDTDVDT